MAQRIGSWRFYPSYGNVDEVVVVKNQAFAVSNHNLWTVDLDYGELTCLDVEAYGLSNRHVVAMAACQQLNSIVLAYESGDIDILNTKTLKVANISGFRNSSVSDKQVNAIVVCEGNAWLCTSFGLICIDIARRSVVDTYNLGDNVLSCAFTEDFVYVSCEKKGLQRCPRSANMHELNEFVNIDSAAPQRLAYWNGQVVGIAPQSVITTKASQTNATRLCVGTFTDLGIINGNLVCVSKSQLTVISPEGNSTVVKTGDRIQRIAPIGNQFVAACGYNGLIRMAFNANEVQRVSGPYMPNGPRLNRFYKMRYAGDRLLVAQGWADYLGSFKETSASYMEPDGSWVNLDTIALGPYSMFANLTDIVQDPNDPTHHFASCYGYGVIEYKDGHKKDILNAGNSPLKTPVPTNAKHYTRVGALAYDDYGTLWMTNTHADSMLVYRTKQGKWGRFYHKDIPRIREGYVLEPYGDYLLAGSTIEEAGILCLYHGGDPTNKKQHRMAFHGRPIVQQDGVSYDTQHLFAAVPDHDGVVWVGTDMGLFVIPSLDDFMGKDFVWQQIKVNRNDGSNYADYLLSGLWITAIAVDAGNRKWIGTDGQGLYLLSPDGQQTLQHFTTDNSPIISDNIQSLSICPATGEVMIGTEAGLCSYMSDAADGAGTLDKDNILVYPNPVPPAYRGMITVRGATDDAEVKVATTSGRVIYRTRCNGGVATWNGCDVRGTRVASGVYYVISSNSDGSDAVVVPIVIGN